MADLIRSLFDLKFSILGFDIDISNIVPTIRSLCDFEQIKQSDIWFLAEIANKFLIPLGLSLLTLFCLIEFFNRSLEIERLSWERIMMVIIKYLFMKMLVTHSFMFITTILGIFNDAFLGLTAVFVNTSGMASLGDTMYNLVNDADGFLMDIMTALIILILYIPFIGTIIGALGQVFIRMVKLIAAVAVAPIPLGISVYEKLQQVSIRYAMSVAAIGLEALLMIICVSIYSIAIGSVSVNGAGVGETVSKLVGMLLANGILMGSLSLSSSLAEKWTGGQ